MASAMMTTIGLENFLAGEDKSLFDLLNLPDGIDKEVLTGSILMRAGEFEVLYPDPYFMRDAIGLWGRKHYRTFDKWVKALNIQYDPLNNYDRTEEYSDTHTGRYDKSVDSSLSGSDTRSDDFTRTDNLSQSDDHTRTDNLSQSDDHTRTDDLKSTNDVTTTNDVSAYNDSAYSPKDKQVIDQDESNTGTQRTAGTTTNTGTQRDAGTTTNTGTQRNAGTSSDTYSNTTGTDENGNDAWTNIHKARMFGNIGVTTSQQMLLSELDQAAVWNLYEHIADLFVTEFCIMVY